MITTSMLRAGLLCGMLCGTAGTLCGLSGCDRKVVETTRTQEGPDGSKVEKTTVIQHDDGTVTQEKKTQTTVVH